MNKVIIDAEEKVRREDIEERIRDSTGSVTQNTEVRRYAKVYIHPEDPRDIADLPTPSIAILDTEHSIDRTLDEENKAFVQDMINNYKQTSRIYKNALTLISWHNDHFTLL